MKVMNHNSMMAQLLTRFNSITLIVINIQFNRIILVLFKMTLMNTMLLLKTLTMRVMVISNTHNR